MPPDNAATIAADAAIEFPNDGPASGAIVSTTSSTFTIGTSGTYRVSFIVPVDEAGQLALRINGVVVPYTVVGRATGTTQIVGESLIAAAAGDTLEVIADPGNFTSLTISPLAGGGSPVSASLVIQKL